VDSVRSTAGPKKRANTTAGLLPRSRNPRSNVAPPTGFEPALPPPEAGTLVYCGVSDVLPGRSPGHLYLEWPRCRVVEPTIDSMSYDSLDFPAAYAKLATARIAREVKSSSVAPAGTQVPTRDLAQDWWYHVPRSAVM
jgi:hypothetical protein